MTDLRQGVTASQHEVLDLLDDCQARWSASISYERQLSIANQYCARALRGGPEHMHRFCLVQGAARLLHAIAQLDAISEAHIATAPDGDDNA